MNKYQKLVQQNYLNNEEEIIDLLGVTYTRALHDIEKKAEALQQDIDKLGVMANLAADANEQATLLSMQRSKVYQKQYQDALAKQINSVLDNMQVEEFKTISEYLNKCYEDGFVGTMFDLQGQGIPMSFPLDQEQMVRAVQLESKISNGLYSALGEDVTALKGRIASEISRGIATGSSFQQIAQQLAGKTKIGYNNAIRIARTEGHRIQQQASMDACHVAKDKGADVVKQWDSTMDSRTRESHTIVDGEIRELDEEFSNGLQFPGDPAGGAAEVINCRCQLLQRARWALDEEELEHLKERAEYFGLDKSQNFEDYKNKYLNASQTPAQPVTPPKKEYLTKKKLEQKIADIDSQQALLQPGSPEWQKLEDQKIDYQEKLDKKIKDAEIKKLKKEQILLQDEIDNFDVQTYSGIWKDDVTTADWAAKHGAVQAKKDYFENKLLYATDVDEVAKWQALIDDLDDFDKNGAAYYELQKRLNQTNTQLKTLQNSGKITVVDDAFTQERKDNALWAKSTKTADQHLRQVSGDVWQNASKDERYAIYDYTCGSGKFNRPLSGFEKPYNEYGSGWEAHFNKGVGNVWIDYEGAGDEIRHMTNIISRSSYDEDIWLQRGCGGNAMESFLGLTPDTFRYMSDSELQQFVGRSNRMYAFTSTGVAKGKGFSGECILNIYAPKGTNMMYAEPFSRFGNGSGLNWDGIATQSSFGYEAEMIIQRGASYTITKIEKSNGTIFIDMEVHPELGYDLYQQDPTEWKGSKKKGR